MRTITAVLVATIVALAATHAAVAKPHSFIVIDSSDGPGFNAEAVAVSADGSVVVGSCGTAAGVQRAFRWTQSGGTVLLDQPAGPTQSWATGVSGDGNTIAGYAGSNTSTRIGWEGVRWQPGGGIDALTSAGAGVWASGISADGATVVGTVQGIGASDQSMAYRWTASGGMQQLGTLYDSLTTHASISRGISADGTTIVGDSNGTQGINSYGDSFRWTDGGGMTALGGAFTASATSRDGQVIVGAADTTNGLQAFRWTAADGIVFLGSVPGHDPGQYTSVALGVSGDGTRVVGYIEDQNTDLRQAFVWQADWGMRLVQDVLVNQFGFGDDLAGWSLTKVYAVSDDGSTLVGRGYSPEGVDMAFRAVFPEPATLTLLALGGLGVVLRRRK
jgi:probable HAF family extracellular repeat protein